MTDQIAGVVSTSSFNFGDVVLWDCLRTATARAARHCRPTEADVTLTRLCCSCLLLVCACRLDSHSDRMRICIPYPSPVYLRFVICSMTAVLRAFGVDCASLAPQSAYNACMGFGLGGERRARNGVTSCSAAWRSKVRAQVEVGRYPFTIQARHITYSLHLPPLFHSLRP